MDIKDGKNKEKTNFLPPKKISTNRDYSVAINDFGELYGWGNNREGRLGFKEEGNDLIENPRKFDYFINKYMKIIEVSSGSSHIAVIAVSKDGSNNENGYVFTWGLDLFGRLGYISDHRRVANGEEEEFTYRFNPVHVKMQDKVTRVCCGTDFTACLTVKGQIYAWGTNKWGNLGIENIAYNNEQYIVRTPNVIGSLLNKFVIQISCGSKHMMALTSERRVYSWGSGDYGVLGHGNDTGINKPQLIKELVTHEIIFITCGEFNSGAITSAGRLYLWGNGKFGRLGLSSEESENIPKPLLDSSLIKEKIFYVSIGFYHTLCCTGYTLLTLVDARTFSWGYSENGRLGSVDKTDCDLKKKILNPREIYQLKGNKIAQVLAGHHHSFAISLSGKVWGWGENVNRVLGEHKNDSEKRKTSKSSILYVPEELNLNKSLTRITGGVQDIWDAYFINTSNILGNLDLSNKCKIVKIACGGTHSLALTNVGDIMAWGYGNSGQLGLGNEKKCLISPTMINFGIDKKFEKIYCGYGHSMAIAKDIHEVYTWGDGSKGQLGKGNNEFCDPSVVDELSGRDIVKGACGHDFSACISQDGRVYIWGSNTNTKLGIDSNNLKEDLPKLIELLVGVKKISLGQNHVATINIHGDLYTWGHGFYGQLGHGDSLTQKFPKKIEFNDVKFRKVKCGSYQTLIIDRKDIVYVSGRGLLNLSTEADKHKFRLEVIEDFKSTKVRSIQAGYGNSICLTTEKELYGFGDNECIKAGGDFQEKFVVKNPKPIKFESDSETKVSIHKIFCGFHHCFAVSSAGDVYGWGNPRNFRLTGEFGEVIPKFPKLLSFNLKSDKKNEDSDKKDDVSKPITDERHIIEMIRTKNKIFSIKEIQYILENLDKKYEDEELKQQDQIFQQEFISHIKSIKDIMNISIRDAYMSVVRLQIMRMKQLGAPRKIQTESLISELIKINMSEIEKLFTLFYLHPCYYLELMEGIQPTEYQLFINGIKYLYKELSHYNKKSESLDNMLLMSTFRILVKIDFSNTKEIDGLFMKTISLSELLLELYFYNTFNRSILLDIFEKTLGDLTKYCNETTKVVTNTGIINTLRILLSDDTSKIGDKDMFRSEHIDQLLALSNVMVSDLESHITKIPVYVCYLIKYIQKKIKKEMINLNQDKKDLQKLKFTLFRLFFKNIISKLFKALAKNNSEYLSKLLGYTNDVKKRVEAYLPLLGEMLDRIILNLGIVYKTSSEIESDPKVEEAISQINEVVKINHFKLYEIFKSKVLKVRYDFKTELISSIIYNNLDFKVKKFQIDLGCLIDFLKICNKKRNKIFNFFTQMNVLNMFETSGQIKSNYTNNDLSQKITFYVNVKYLVDPKSFVTKHLKSIKVTEKDLKEIKIGKCSKCFVMMPQPFISEDYYDENIIKSFEHKVVNRAFFYLSDILNYHTFEKDNLSTITQLYEALKNLLNKLIITKTLTEECKLIIMTVEEEINKGDNEAEKLQNFLLSIQKHVRKKLNHYTTWTKALKLLNDLPDAKEYLRNQLIAINDDLNLAKKDLKEMKNSIEIYQDKDRKEIELTHKKRDLIDYSKKDDNVFRYRMLEIPSNILFEKGILLDFGHINEEKSNIILQLSANQSKRFFDLKLNLKKSKELVKSYSFTYDDYVYYNINSNILSVLDFEDFGKFNATLFYDMIHRQIHDH